jgi:hypothetical protein
MNWSIKSWDLGLTCQADSFVNSLTKALSGKHVSVHSRAPPCVQHQADCTNIYQGLGNKKWKP